MSLKPGLGANFMHDVASTLLDHRLDETQVDVPSHLRHGTKMMPLGRYLKGKLREAIGKSADTPQEAFNQYTEEMRSVFLRSIDNKTSLKTQLIEENQGKYARLEARNRIYKKRGSI